MQPIRLVLERVWWVLYIEVPGLCYESLHGQVCGDVGQQGVDEGHLWGQGKDLLTTVQHDLQDKIRQGLRL